MFNPHALMVGLSFLMSGTGWPALGRLGETCRQRDVVM